MTNTRYETRALLANRYMKQGGPKLTHVLDTVHNYVLCGRVNPESVADVFASDPNAAPTCKSCAKKIANIRQREAK